MSMETPQERPSDPALAPTKPPADPGVEEDGPTDLGPGDTLADPVVND